MTPPRTDPSPFDVQDRSLLRPAFDRHYFSKAFRLLPRRLTANFVTLGAFASTCVLLVFATRLVDVASAGALALIYLVGTQLYVVGDHLDGMQAVASRTTSPLGEFLDHWLDMISGSILGLACFSLMESVPPAVALGSLWLYLLAFTATYAERAETRELHFHRLGALEAVVVVSVFFATCAVPWGRALWNAPVFVEAGGVLGVAGALEARGWWVVVAVLVAGFAGTLVAIVRRMGGVRRAPGGFVRYAAVSGVGVAALVVAGGPSAGGAFGAGSALPTGGGMAGSDLVVLGWLFLTLHGADYLARVMQQIGRAHV